MNEYRLKVVLVAKYHQQGRPHNLILKVEFSEANDLDATKTAEALTLCYLGLVHLNSYELESKELQVLSRSRPKKD